MDNLGYVKLFRAIMDEAVFDDADLWRLYCWCLMKASHKERDHVMNKRIVHLEPGQFIYGRKRAAEVLDRSESTVYKWMLKLKELGVIDIKTTKDYSIIIVKDWYMQITDEEQKNSKRTAKGKKEDTDKNVKNVKNVKKAESNKSLDLADEFKKMTEGKA